MRTEKLSILALGFCGISAIVGCGDQGSGSNAPASSNQESTGEVNLALQLANGGTLNSATYTIVGPKGFSKTGSIDLSSATKLSATIGGLPVGTGYTITINATTTDESRPPLRNAPNGTSDTRRLLTALSSRRASSTSASASLIWCLGPSSSE